MYCSEPAVRVALLPHDMYKRMIAMLEKHPHYYIAKVTRAKPKPENHKDKPEKLL